jgi:hypothetical protein
MLATAFALLIVWAGIGILDHEGITQGAAASLSPIIAVPILILLCAGVWRFAQQHHLMPQHVRH